MVHENNTSEDLRDENIEAEDSLEILEEEVAQALEELIEEEPLIVLERENQKLKDTYLRLSAETDNYRKRIQQEKENFKKIALKEVVEKLLPVSDNLERTIQATENSNNLDSLKEGVSMVLSQFESVLKDVGLETIEVSIGDEFDPQFCEAVVLEERDDVEHSMTIIDVFETGKKLGGQIIRTVKVKVAKKI